MLRRACSDHAWPPYVQFKRENVLLPLQEAEAVRAEVCQGQCLQQNLCCCHCLAGNARQYGLSLEQHHVMHPCWRLRQDEEAFNTDFAAAFAKLLELGVPAFGEVLLPVFCGVWQFLAGAVCLFTDVQQLSAWTCRSADVLSCRQRVRWQPLACSPIWAGHSSWQLVPQRTHGLEHQMLKSSSTA